MLKKHRTEVLLIGIPILLLVIVIFFSFVYVNKTDLIGKASYSTLSAEQKQAYWECFKTNKCSELLVAKKNKEYRECSLSCNKQAQTPTANSWCEDSDKGDNFFEKGIVKSNIYLSGKEDSCYTFPDSGKTYLFEGQCKNNKYQYVQKNCGEVEKDFVCKEGTCKTKNTIFNGDGEYLTEEGDSLIANNGVIIKPVKFLNSWLVTILFDVYIGNEKVNLHPIRFNPTKDATHLIDYAVKLNIISKEENKVKLSIESVEDGPIQSCVDLYNYCKNFGFSESTCSRAYCPTKAVDTEVKLEKENIVLFVDKEYQPYGEYLLDQAFYCNNELKKYLTVKPVFDTIYIKALPSDSSAYITSETGINWAIASALDKSFFNDKKPIGACIEPSLAHELVHYYTQSSPVADKVEEGFAVFMQHQTGVLGKSGTTNGPILCGEEGFKGIINYCPLGCANNCFGEVEGFANLAFDIPVTIADATLTISKEGDYLVNVTVDQNGVITSQLFYGNILILINGKPVYIVLEAGDYLAVVYSQNNEQCFNECSLTCPITTSDGYVEYLDLTKTKYGGTISNDLIYASSYCFFESLKQKGDALKKYEDTLVEYRNDNKNLCIGDFLKETMGDESTLMINKFKIGKLCGVPFGYSGDNWHKLN